MIKTLTPDECAELILEAKNPTVAMHIRPDGDTVGTAAALIAIFRRLGRSASYICADEIPDRLAFLLEGVPRADRASGELFCVDVASRSQLGTLADTLPLPVCVIDHHETNAPFAPHLTRPEASSAGEVLFLVLEELLRRGALTLDADIAEKIYAAISSDTGCFCFSNASAATHGVAARLISVGIDSAAINHRLFHSKSESQIRAEGYVGSKMRSYLGGRIAAVALSLSEISALGLSLADFDSAIEVVRSLRSSEIAVVIKEIGEGVFKASLRSHSVRVSEVAASFGGGGHALAAGCTVEADSAEAALDRLISTLEELL